MIISNPIWRQRSFQIEMVLLLILIMVAGWMNFSLVLRNPNITGDGIQYTSVVFNWFQGNGYTNVVGIPWLVEPGYGFLTYLFNIFIGDIELSGMLVSSAAYLLLILLVYFTVRYLGSALAALLSVLFVAFYPYLLTFSWLNLTDSVFSFFVFLCFSVYVRVLLEEKKVVISVLLGVLLGFTTLIRPEGYVSAFLTTGSLFCLAAWTVYRDRAICKTLGEKLRVFIPVLMAMISFSIVVLPFIFFIHQITSLWVLTPKSIYMPDKQLTMSGSQEGTIPGSANSQPTEIVQNTTPSGQAPTKKLTFIPPLYVERLGDNFPIWLKYFEIMSAQALFSLFIALCIYGFFKLGDVSIASSGRNHQREVRSKPKIHTKKPLKALIGGTLFQSDSLFRMPPSTQRDRLILFALGIFFMPCFAYLFRLLMYRYLLPYMVYFLIFIALWLTTLMDKMRIKLALSSSLPIFIFICITWFFAISQTGTTFLANVTSSSNMSSLPQAFQIQHVNLGIRAAGLWLRDHVDMRKDPLLGTSKNTQNGCQLILFQAIGKEFPVHGRCVTAFNLEKIERFAQENGDYFILDNDSVKYFPELASIWKEPNMMVSYGFKPFYQDPEGLFQIYINSKRIG